MIQEFKDFINKGNLVELAVAFVLGLAFATLVSSFVEDIVMQIVAAIFGKPDFSDLSFDLGDAEIFYGSFINALIAFLVVAAVMFLIVKAYNHMRPPADAGPTEIDLLTEIRDELQRRP